MKIFTGSAFEVCFGVNSTILTNWGDNDKAMYETSVSNETVSGLVKDIQDSTTDFAKTSLREKQPCDIYQEFLELTTTRDMVQGPGSYHHVRQSDLLSKNLDVSTPVQGYT